jgi:hypothetical protein
MARAARSSSESGYPSRAVPSPVSSFSVAGVCDPGQTFFLLPHVHRLSLSVHHFPPTHLLTSSPLTPPAGEVRVKCTSKKPVFPEQMLPTLHPPLRHFFHAKNISSIYSSGNPQLFKNCRAHAGEMQHKILIFPEKSTLGQLHHFTNNRTTIELPATLPTAYCIPPTFWPTTPPIAKRSRQWTELLIDTAHLYRIGS